LSPTKKASHDVPIKAPQGTPSQNGSIDSNRLCIHDNLSDTSSLHSVAKKPEMRTNAIKKSHERRSLTISDRIKQLQASAGVNVELTQQPDSARKHSLGVKRHGSSASTKQQRPYSAIGHIE